MVAGRRRRSLRCWHLSGMVLVVLIAGGGPAGTMVGVYGSADQVSDMICPVVLRVLLGVLGAGPSHTCLSPRAVTRRAALFCFDHKLD